MARHIPGKDTKSVLPKSIKPLTAELQSFKININDNLTVATTAEWDAQRELIAKEGVVYVYSDHHTNPDGQPVPGFKVGDGKAYLIDLPFNDDLAMRHIANTTIHVTEEEKEFWNDKVTAYMDAENAECLVLSKD